VSLLYTVTQSGAAGAVTPQNSPDLPVGQYHELSVDLTLTSFTGGASPSINVLTKRKGADGVYYTVDTPTAITAAGPISRSIGGGLGISSTFTGFGDVVQVSVVITGAPTAASWSVSVTAK
jgi:hypothetical protein